MSQTVICAMVKHKLLHISAPNIFIMKQSVLQAIWK